MLAILVTQEAEIRRSQFKASPGKNLQVPISTIKAGCGGVCLQFQICRKHTQEDCGPGQSKHKLEVLLKYLKQKELTEWLK
jgi:Fe-S cluster assembly iron-binding protein IscA